MFETTSLGRGLERCWRIMECVTLKARETVPKHWTLADKVVSTEIHAKYKKNLHVYTDNEQLPKLPKRVEPGLSGQLQTSQGRGLK